MARMGWKRMTETLENLLREWAAIEPERCDRNYEEPEEFAVSIAGIWFQMTEFADIFVKLPVLQVAIQEAIEARGWIWSVRGHSTHAVSRVWLNIQSDDHEVTANTPAEAILSAYLQALKANA